MARRAWLLSSLALVVPIPFTPTQPTYTGSPATPRRIQGIPPTPQNPYMAPNDHSEIHNDGWQTDAYRWGGPLGRSPQTLSSELIPQRDCGTIAIDRAGRLVSICIGLGGPELFMFNPNTLETLATFTLPPRQSVPSNIFQDFTGGGYFYLDNRDRVVTATTTRHIYVIDETAGSPGFSLEHDYDLSSVLNANEKITSALPDSNGLLWIVSKTDGVVATLNFATGKLQHVQLGNGANGEIENSFAVGQHGDVYIATNRKLYRFTAGKDGMPKIQWQLTYPNSGETKRGQVDDGTGTTPTIMQGGYVNITDNADPMDIVVYRTAVKPTRVVKRHHRGHRGHRRHRPHREHARNQHRRRHRRVPAPRMVCKVPIFSKGSSADENSIIVAGGAMIAENNYGYNDPTDVTGGKTTSPGFVRVDINKNGNGCHTVWTNTTATAPTVVSKLSIANGLIYTYTKPPGSNDPWYWTALDFRTGKTVFKQLSGTGIGYNNNYAGITLGPNGTAYLGTLGGIIAMRDMK